MASLLLLIILTGLSARLVGAILILKKALLLVNQNPKTQRQKTVYWLQYRQLNLRWCFRSVHTEWFGTGVVWMWAPELKVRAIILRVYHWIKSIQVPGANIFISSL